MDNQNSTEQSFDPDNLDWILRILDWREKYISERTFLLWLALVTGVVSGFAALLLKWLIHLIAAMMT